jgi:plastocyanin
MRVLRLAGAAVVIAGCGGGGGGGGGGTPPPPAVSAVVITPGTAQSITVGATVQFSAQPRDAQGGNLTRAVTWTNSDPSKVSLSATTGSPVTATGVAAGSSNIRAVSELIQSTQVAVTVTPGGAPAQSADVSATPTDVFDPASVTIGAGGTVTWTFAPAPTVHNVTFGTNKPTGGDIGNTSGAAVSRTFPTTGSYPYSCTVHPGMNGTVTVVQP